MSGQFEHQVLFNPPPSERESQGVKEVVEESHKRKAVEEVTVVKKQKLSSNGNPDVPWFDSSAGIVLVGEKDGVEWRGWATGRCWCGQRSGMRGKRRLPLLILTVP